MLNHNCFVINVLNSASGVTNGIIRPFSVCDNKNTDSFSGGFDINYDGNIIIAGSNGGGYYIGMKSPVLQSI
jgi:hypothetical protein